MNNGNVQNQHVVEQFAMVVERTPLQPSTEMPEEAFPFGVDFQKSLIRVLCDDDCFSHIALEHLEPKYFENEVLSWACDLMVKYREHYGVTPSVKVLLEETRRLDPSLQTVYVQTLEQVAVADLRSEAWLRDQTKDFIKRNVFVRAMRDSTVLYNSGKIAQAYDKMMSNMEQIVHSEWEEVDSADFYATFEQRQNRRRATDPYADTISTGINELDKVLAGGLSLGELGIWVADAKHGKSTLLVNHGVRAVSRGNHNVLHCIFEASRKQLEDRYDTAHIQEDYHRVKSGEIDFQRYQDIMAEYQMKFGKLQVRAFVKEWDYTVKHIWEEMKRLRRLFNFIPELVIVDYGDLIKSDDKLLRSTFEVQRAVFRELKSIANRGFALWTASQSQRPAVGGDVSEKLLQVRQVADCYEKVRVADFLGTINCTLEERKQKMMRLYMELYRDNEADRVLPVYADFSQMTIRALPGVTSMFPSQANGSGPQLGYVAQAPQQTRAPI